MKGVRKKEIKYKKKEIKLPRKQRVNPNTSGKRQYIYRGNRRKKNTKIYEDEKKGFSYSEIRALIKIASECKITCYSFDTKSRSGHKS